MLPYFVNKVIMNVLKIKIINQIAKNIVDAFKPNTLNVENASTYIKCKS